MDRDRSPHPRRVHPFSDFQDTVEAGALRWGPGALRWGPGAVELAERVGVDPTGLVDTVARAAACARGEAEDEFGRQYWEAPLEGDLAAIPVRPALFHTQGGLLVDEHARVLASDGAPIAGLYASGGAAVGMSGHGASGYLAGNGLLPAFGLAFLAAEHVCKQ
jgi:fumarate reductase flavoprotein subunit